MVLLVSMSYDRYGVICKPNHYSSIMNRHVCIGLVMPSLDHWLCANDMYPIINPLVIIVNCYNCKTDPFWIPGIGQFCFLFFCHILFVIKLASLDIYVLEILINVDTGVLATI